MQQHIPGTSISDEYIAGFFDGEGCISIDPPRKTSLYVLHVQISQTEPAVLFLIKERFGGKVTRQERKSHHRGIYHWSAQAKVAERFLRAIYPYLVVKRPQADLALEFRRLFRGENIVPRGPHKSVHHLAKRDRIVAERAAIYTRMRTLNLRGAAALTRDKENTR